MKLQHKDINQLKGRSGIAPFVIPMHCLKEPAHLYPYASLLQVPPQSFGALSQSLVSLLSSVQVSVSLCPISLSITEIKNNIFSHWVNSFSEFPQYT